LRFREARSDQRAYWIALAVALLLGVILRFHGQFVDATSFWFDEAVWANRLGTRSVLDMAIRPIGLMAAMKLIGWIFGYSEFWLRSLSSVAGFATLFLMPYVASRLFESRVSRVLLVLLWALQPALIDYSKEFKPYSFEVLVHLVPLVLFLRYRQTGRAGYFWGLVASLPLLFPFVYSLSFAYPGLLLWALYEGWKTRRWRGVLPVAASGLACVAIIGAIYGLILFRASTEGNERYWGRKYDVFYTQTHAERGEKRAAWFSEKYTDMVALPGLRRELWRPPAFVPEAVSRTLFRADRVLWLLLSTAGIVYLALRRRELLLLFVSPFVVLLLLNVVGKWPIGAFRTNVFACTYLLPLPIFGFDWLARRSVKAAGLAGATVAFVTLLPGFAFGFQLAQPKTLWGTRQHQQREIITFLRDEREKLLEGDPRSPKQRLILDCHTWYPHQYYMQTHPEFSRAHRKFFERNFTIDSRCGDAKAVNRALDKQLRRGKTPAWVVVSKRGAIEPVYRHAKRAGEILFEKRMDNDHLILLVQGTGSQAKKKPSKKGKRRKKARRPANEPSQSSSD
jgi:hypothetical protein